MGPRRSDSDLIGVWSGVGGGELGGARKEEERFGYTIYGLFEIRKERERERERETPNKENSNPPLLISSFLPILMHRYFSPLQLLHLSPSYP